jgi:hypothetical protein
VEIEFKWTPGVSGPDDQDPIFIHLDFEDWANDLLEKQPDGSYLIYRMVPPKKIKYFFTADGVPRVAEDKPIVSMSQPFNREVLYYGNSPKHVY